MRLHRVAALLLVLLAAACPAAPARRPHLLLVTVETTRADHLGKTIDGVALTPRLDAFAARGTRFDRGYAAASFTLPSLHTILTGETPPVHGVRFWTHFGRRFKGATLAERLRDAGYATASFTSGYSSFTPYPILARGFGTTHREDRADAAKVIAPFEAWLDGRKAADAPFFAWVHVFEPHTPYAPAEKWCEGLLDVAAYRKAGPADWPVEKWLPRAAAAGAANPALLADRLYAADVRAADAAVGDLLAALARRGLAESTVVCVVADHGENLSQDPDPRWDHGVSCDEQLVRVPFLLAGPSVAAGRRDDAIARHLDVAPTLLRLAAADPGDLPGRDLLGAAPAPPFAIAEGATYKDPKAPFYSVTDGRRSLRLFTDAAPARAFLRREGPGEDPRAPLETAVDLSAPPPGAAPLVDAWKRAAAETADRAARLNGPGGDDGELTEEQRRVLQMGGYLGGR